MRSALTALRVALTFLCATAVMLTVSRIASAPLLQLDLRVLDAWFRLRAAISSPPQSDVAIIAEDDRSARDLQTSGALYKMYHPHLLRHLAGDPTVRVVAFDHNFVATTPYDGAFAAALAERSAKTVVGNASTNIAIAGIQSPRGYLDGIVYTAGAARFIEIARHQADHCWPAFSLAAVAAFYALNTSRQLTCDNREVSLAPHLSIPVDDRGFTMINFLGPAGTIPTVSYVDVITHGSRALQELSRRDKVLLVGETSKEYRQELHYTPFGRMSGVEVQANIVQMLLHGRLIHRLTWTHVVAILSCFALLASILLTQLTALRVVTVAIAWVTFGTFLLAYVAFAFGHLWTEAATYVFLFLVGLLVAALARIIHLLPLSPAQEWHKISIEFLGGSLAALIGGHATVPFALLIGLLTPIAIALFGLVHRSGATAMAAVMLFVVTLGPGVAIAQQWSCGAIDTIVEEDDKTPRDPQAARGSSRINLVRKGERIGEVTRGLRLFDQDELWWSTGVSFTVAYDKGTVLIFGPSRSPATLRITCTEKSITASIRNIRGRIRSFVQDGAVLRIPIDEVVTAGTRQTIFSLDIDSERQQVHLIVFEGTVVLDRAGLLFEVATDRALTLPYRGLPKPTLPISQDVRESFRIETIRDYAVYQLSQFQSVQRLLSQPRRLDPSRPAGPR